MKTKLHWLALIMVSAAFLSAPAQAGNNRHSSGNSAQATTGARAGTSAARGNFSAGGRVMMQGQRFSSPNSVRSNAFHPNYIHPNGIASIGQRQFTPGTRNGGNRVGSIGNGNSVRNSGGNNHLFARRSGDWHRDWDRHHDHFWHGHRCRFVNNSWFIFDLGFSPWYGYPYDDYYPYAYGYGYGYDAYPYGYDGGVYEGANPDYYDSRAGGSSDQYTDNNVAAAQERLARQGYYHGSIDGSYGPETRRAVMRYQRDHGLRVTGHLTADTLAALGLSREVS
jgi:hypothetical protein